MTDFEEAFRRGLDAQKRASAARKEVDEVLVAASTAISQVAGVSISLGLSEVTRPGRNQSLHERVALIPAPTERVTVLIARTVGGNSQELAEIEVAELVFPVTLRWQDNVVFAQNKPEFEEAIATLLSSAHTGAALEKLIYVAPNA